jgi:hypothetical protein
MTTTVSHDARHPAVEALLTRMARPRAQLALVWLGAWAPLIVIGAIEKTLTGRTSPLLVDPAVHVRLLVAAPLIIVAELALAKQAAMSLRRLADEGFIVADARPRFDAIVARSVRLTQAFAARVVLTAVAILFGVVMVATRRTGLVSGEATSELTATRVWYAAVALPVFGYVMARSLARWLFWVLTLIDTARLGLRLAAGHPDRRGGIGFLVLPSLAFFAPYLLGTSSVLAAASVRPVLDHEIGMSQVQHLFIAAAIVSVVVALGPLLVFTPQLFRVARQSIFQYGKLATDYTRRFDGRWFATSSRDDLLGTSDLQSLNDLGGQWRETVEKTSLVVFRLRDLIILLVAVLLPTVPLLLTVMPVEAVLAKVGKLMMGVH